MRVMAMPKRRNLTQEQAARVAVAGMFSPVDRKLARKLRRQGKLAAAEAAERRNQLRRRATKESRRSPINGRICNSVFQITKTE